MSGQADDRPVIAWTLPMLKRFKRAYVQAAAAGAASFTFDGNVFLPAYAGYLIEYLESKL